MVKYKFYLIHNVFPKIQTNIICDNCNHTINAGPNYKPRFCDMCGAPIKDNLNKVEWKNGTASCADYATYMIEEHPDWVIKKVKYECTEWGRIGLPKDVEHIPVFIGETMEDIMNLANYDGHLYFEEDFEQATKNELLEYAKTCNSTWRVR